MNWSAGLAPELVWGLIPRFVGLLYVIAFGALSFQLEQILGSRGIAPLAPRFVAAKRDFGFRRFFDFPSVFWLSSSDAMIRAVPYIGLVAGIIACCGGWFSWVGLFVGWFLWLSVEPAGLIFPWDTMLQEAGFLALFLPTAEALPSLETAHLPLPTVAFMFRWLVLRLMLGFAKVKFIGTGKGDSLYLRGFLIWAPMPTPVAWWGHHMPQWFLRLSLAFMFVGEAIAPVLGFFTGPLRIVSFLIMTMLMIGIETTGNWGYFNLGFVLLCVSLLDINNSVFDVFKAPWSETALSWPDVAIHGAMVVLFLTSLVYAIVMNSWVTRTWVHWLWETVTWNRAWGRWLISYFRALAPFHITNGYGVFPPNAAPPLRLAPVIEGSYDGKEWKAYRYKFLPTRATDKLPLVAPHHPRFDQALYYCVIGIHDASFFNSLIGDGTPYLGYLRSSWLERVGQRLLEGEPLAGREFGETPFPDPNNPPKLIRVSAYALAPTRIDEYKRTGERWRVRRVGTIVAPRGLRPWMDAQSIPEPELFHMDFVNHKRRARPLRELVRIHAQGEPPDRAVLAMSDLTSEEVERFWTEFVPAVNEHRGDWEHVTERAQALEERFGPVAIYRFERLLQRFSWLLRMHTEDHFVRGVPPKIELLSNFRYEMLLHEMIIDGREAYLEFLKQPQLAAERARRTTDETQLWALAMVRYDMMMFHIRTFRWNNIGEHGYKYKIHGIFEYAPMLMKVQPPDEEYRPQPRKHDDGEFTVDGIYAAPQEPSLGPPTTT